MINNEQPQGVTETGLSPEDKECALGEIKRIQAIVSALMNRDTDYAYADTGDSMKVLDGILSSNSAYKDSLALRREASRKIMQEDDTLKHEGLKEIVTWAEKIAMML